MLSTITLKRPGNKDEECALLDSIAELVKDGTYLEELFTPEMVNDMQGRIRNDFHCNLYADYRESAAICDKLEDDIHDKDRVVAETKSFADGAIQNKNQIIMQMQETIDKLEATIQAGSDRMAAACETTQQAYNEVSQLQNALSNREMEVCQLKAKLYPLSLALPAGQ